VCVCVCVCVCARARAHVQAVGTYESVNLCVVDDLGQQRNKRDARARGHSQIVRNSAGQGVWGDARVSIGVCIGVGIGVCIEIQDPFVCHRAAFKPFFDLFRV